jgi:hypothetical protein
VTSFTLAAPVSACAARFAKNACGVRPALILAVSCTKMHVTLSSQLQLLNLLNKVAKNTA